MLPTVAPNTTIAVNSAILVYSENAMAIIATLCTVVRVTVNPAIGTRNTTRPPIKRATTDVPARNSVANDAVPLVGALLGEAHELLDRPDLRAEHEQVAECDGDEEPRVRTASA